MYLTLEPWQGREHKKKHTKRILLIIGFTCVQGMGDFLNEMAVMMSQTKSSVSFPLGHFLIIV